MSDRADPAEQQGTKGEGIRSHERKRNRLRRRLYRQVNELESALGRLALEIYTELHGGTPQAFPENARFSLELSPLGNHPDQPGLFEQLERLTRELSLQTGAFRPGAVYCYRCESNRCEHAVPPGPRHVFQAYGSTGIPQWSELVQVHITEAYNLTVPRRQGCSHDIHSPPAAADQHDPGFRCLCGFQCPDGSYAGEGTT